MSAQYFLGGCWWNFLNFIRVARKGKLFTCLPKKKKKIPYFIILVLFCYLLCGEQKRTQRFTLQNQVSIFLSHRSSGGRGKKEEGKKKSHINNESDAQSLQISHTAFEVIFYFFIFWVGFFFHLLFFLLWEPDKLFFKKALRRLRRRQFKKFALILSKQKKDSFCCIWELQSFEQKALQ